MIELLNRAPVNNEIKALGELATSRIDVSRRQTLIKQSGSPPARASFQHFDVRGNRARANTRIDFIRSLARAIDAEPRIAGFLFGVRRQGDTVHAARQATDGSGLRLMSMADGGTLSPVAAFEADQSTDVSCLRNMPGRDWSISSAAVPSRDVPLRGSDPGTCIPNLGSEAWSVTLLRGMTSRRKREPSSSRRRAVRAKSG